MQVCWVYSWGCGRMLREGRGWYTPQLSEMKRNLCTKGLATDGGMYHTGRGAQDRSPGQQHPALSWFTHPMLASELSRDILYVPCSDDLVPPPLPFPTGVVVFWPVGGLETSSVCRRKSLQGVYCRDQGSQGGPAPGWSADWGFGKEEGRGPGCLNSWDGLAIPLSPPSFRA